MAKEVRIACPKCNWEPDGGAHWSCTCGFMWNTFDTGGRCPNCGKQWKYTQCIPHLGGCPEWSLHEDWYRGLDEWLEEELEAINRELVVEIQDSAVAFFTRERFLRSYKRYAFEKHVFAKKGW